MNPSNLSDQEPLNKKIKLKHDSTINNTDEKPVVLIDPVKPLDKSINLLNPINLLEKSIDSLNKK
jgi:hypothetical protein